MRKYALWASATETAHKPKLHRHRGLVSGKGKKKKISDRRHWAWGKSVAEVEKKGPKIRAVGRSNPADRGDPYKKKKKPKKQNQKKKVRAAAAKYP